MSPFLKRHIGPNPSETKDMLTTLGFSNLEEMANHIIPKNIRTRHSFEQIGPGLSEAQWLEKIKKTLSQNQSFQSLIGMGFYGTFTPPVIQRNILENPAWYTAYTPYQPEISQGRLEALLNFQTMVTDLTGMEISNASLLDEGSAAAEAMSMAFNLQKKGKESVTFVVDSDVHPHVIEVLKTRSEPLGLKMILTSAADYDFSENIFAVFVSYPNTEGRVSDYSDLTQKAHSHSAFLIADVDLLSLTLITPPGEWGADIVIGNTQRFGVPMGYGGPHAAFLATKDEYKRLMPGRLVGVSKDAHGNSALRLALQTREQHIRREKATSNICTAQVLLANMASMYAVYHGPEGLKQIAVRIHRLAQTLSEKLKALGEKIKYDSFFDTLTVLTPQRGHEIYKKALEQKINLRIYPTIASHMISASTPIEALGISLDELCDETTIEKIVNAFNASQPSANITKQTPHLEEKNLTYSFLKSLVRTSPYLTHSVFNIHHTEHGLTRYIFSLQNKDISLIHSMIPLGSCTMKLNATAELIPISWPEISQLHPFAPPIASSRHD
jgi:glycine dehydrogenase